MINRNDPCWCGSEKKYKKCHLADDLIYGKKTPCKNTCQKKDRREIDGMRRAGAFNGELMDYVRPFVKAGAPTAEIDALVHGYTVRHGHTPACLGYRGFPRSSCTSINNVVCHGIPSEKDVLREGDIVNVDLTTIVEGFHADSSETFLIGRVSDKALHLATVAGRALASGIGAVMPGRPLRSIAEAIEPYVRSEGCSIVRQYTGHGIGEKFHEGFTVYHHLDPDCEQVILEPGMTFTIEPMINLGGWEVTVDDEDGWTVRTKDGSLSAQFEHTVLVTEHGADILTLTPTQIADGACLGIGGTLIPLTRGNA